MGLVPDFPVLGLVSFQKQTHRLREGTYGYQGGEGWSGVIAREFGINRYTLLYLKWKDFPGGPVFKILQFQCRRAQVGSPIGELRSHMPHMPHAMAKDFF